MLSHLRLHNLFILSLWKTQHSQADGCEWHGPASSQTCQLLQCETAQHKEPFMSRKQGRILWRWCILSVGLFTHPFPQRNYSVNQWNIDLVCKCGICCSIWKIHLACSDNTTLEPYRFENGYSCLQLFYAHAEPVLLFRRKCSRERPDKPHPPQAILILLLDVYRTARQGKASLCK